MRVQCFCGAGVHTWRAKFVEVWMTNHSCPGVPESTHDDDDTKNEHEYVDGGRADNDRSFQWNGQWDGEYRYLPEVQAGQPIGFQIQ